MIKGGGAGLPADISLPAASMFEFDKSDMSDAGKAQVEQCITKHRAELSDAYLVLVVDHTNTSGDESYNQALSQKRARSVAAYLVPKVVKVVKADALRFIGRGSKDPLDSNDTSKGRIQNRHVDILAVAEVRALDAMLFPSVALFERRSGELSAQGQALLEKTIWLPSRL
jgi:outer membrane protein OmpA-like peptidoglycan-associated protein